MQIEMIAVSELVPYARNTRTHSDAQIDQVAESIKQFGFTNPVLIDAAGGIIAGHGRALAAIKIGMVDVPCIRLLHLTEAQKRAYVIADNKLAINSGWDEKMLSLELKDLQSMGFDLSFTGFDLQDINGIMAKADATTVGKTDDDAAPALQAVAITQAGDVWLLGNHRVMCGDATNAQHAKALMGGGLADLFITDPPYNVAYEGKTQDSLTIQNDSMSDGDFRAFIRDSYAAANAVMRPGAAFYVWHAALEGFNFTAAASDIGWKIRQCLVWAKNSMALGRQDYQWRHEPCLYGWKDGAAHTWNSDRKQTTLLEFNKPVRNGVHPTMKPVDLIQYQVENSSKPGQIVLDLFGGSGTTLIACEKTGRLNRSMELDEKYCDVIVRRWQQFTGKVAFLESTGLPFPETLDKAA